MNTEQALSEIGTRLKRRRLNMDRSQKERLEDGKGATLANFIRVLNALEALDSLDAFLPAPAISPIQLAKLQGKLRQKASRKS